MNTFFQHNVSSNLFSEVLDVRVKQGAKLSTDHHLVVCSVQISKPWLIRKARRSRVAYRIKWETLADRDVRKQFASSMVAKFQQLLEVSEDIQMEWSLFRTVMISLAVENCGRKRLRMAAGSEKKYLVEPRCQKSYPSKERYI